MRREEKKKVRIIVLIVAIVSFILGRCSVGDCDKCSNRSTDNVETTDSISSKDNAKTTEVKEEKTSKGEPVKISLNNPFKDKSAAEILNYHPDEKWNNFIESSDDVVAQPLKTNFHGSRSKEFNDSNNIQLEAAKKMGIEPIVDMASTWNLSRPIRKIASCEEYYLDKLTHSYPYLVPEAEVLLREIGARFNQLLWERGKSKYRIKVTSVLRTSENIKELMKSNSNAIETSTHQYATTFDISYSRFVQDSAENPRTFADLSALLSEVMLEFKNKGRCYIKYEAKQSCFHVTVRPQN